eukprot:2647812-Pyramimonas_sp.AAC.1
MVDQEVWGDMDGGWNIDGHLRADESSHATRTPAVQGLLRGHLEDYPQGAQEAHDAHAPPPAWH